MRWLRWWILRLRKEEDPEEIRKWIEAYLLYLDFTRGLENIEEDEIIRIVFAEMKPRVRIPEDILYQMIVEELRKLRKVSNSDQNRKKEQKRSFQYPHP